MENTEIKLAEFYENTDKWENRELGADEEFASLANEADDDELMSLLNEPEDENIDSKMQLISIRLPQTLIADLKKIGKSETSEIEGLKITVRTLTNEDIQKRKLPIGTTGVVITNIEKDSPINYLDINNIIVEAQKKKIKTISDLQNIIKSTLKSSEKTILIAIYNNQNQRRYIGVKLE